RSFSRSAPGPSSAAGAPPSPSCTASSKRGAQPLPTLPPDPLPDNPSPNRQPPQGRKRSAWQHTPFFYAILFKGPPVPGRPLPSREDDVPGVGPPSASVFLDRGRIVSWATDGISAPPTAIATTNPSLGTRWIVNHPSIMLVGQSPEVQGLRWQSEHRLRIG